MILAGSVLLALSSTACLPVLAQTPTAAQTAEAACGPFNVKFHVSATSALTKPSAASGMALVYVVEDLGGPEFSGEIGIEPTVRVGIDGHWIGADRNNSYLAFAIAPGEHHVCVNWQTSLEEEPDVVALGNVTAQAGKTYYLRVFFRNLAAFPSHNGMYPAIVLEHIDPDEGRLLVGEYPQSDFRRQK